MAPRAAAAKLPDVAGPVEEADRIYDALRIAIRDGEVAPGRRLASERKLAEDLAAPRTAVRRALQRLSAEGLVERGIGRAGSRVRQTEEVQAATTARAASPQDVLEARWAFEPGLVPLIIARATEDDFLAMERMLDRMEKAATQQEFRECGYGFHLELARATRNPLLVDMFEHIVEARARAGWGRLVSLNATPEQRTAQIGRNRKVVDALRQRDGAAAAAALRDHLARMLDEIARGPRA
ncbi:MAG: FCD domain-containing protein [Tagaea sp.]|nr:FCD domain-containing protein [Tagaea sp.]